LFLSGCSWGNLQTYEKGNISATGVNYMCWGNFHYYQLQIGNDNSPYYRHPSDWTLRLPDNTDVKSSQLTPEYLSQINGVVIAEFHTERGNRGTSYSLKYGVDSDGSWLNFYFVDNRLFWIAMGSNYAFCPPEQINLRIGTSDGKHIYYFPLQEAQLRELFGPPDRLETSWLVP